MTPDDLIAGWAADHEPGCVLAVEAHLLVEKLRRSDPDTLAKWLDDRAEELVARHMQSLLVSERGLDRHRRRGRTFAKFVGQDGEQTWDEFALEYCVNDANEWKPVRLMTKADCQFVAADRERRAKANGLEAAFMRALARRLKAGQTVGDVFTVQQVSALMDRP